MASLYPARLYKRPTGWYPLIDTNVAYTFTPNATATFETELTVGDENVRSAVFFAGVADPGWEIAMPDGTYSVRVTTWAFIRASGGDTADISIPPANYPNESVTPNSSFAPTPITQTAVFLSPLNKISFSCGSADGIIVIQVEVYLSNGELGVAP